MAVELLRQIQPSEPIEATGRDIPAILMDPSYEYFAEDKMITWMEGTVTDIRSNVDENGVVGLQVEVSQKDEGHVVFNASSILEHRTLWERREDAIGREANYAHVGGFGVAAVHINHTDIPWNNIT